MWRSVVSVCAGVALALPAAVTGHVEQRSGPFRITMGWGQEPAFSGAPNSVDVAVTDASGKPVQARPGALEAEVSFGPAVTTLPLEPAGQPGRFRAVIVPTRPGTYAFHVTGTVRGRAIEARATCSGATFDCVTTGSDVQFPAREPSAGELAQRVEREAARADDAADRADSARTLAIAAIVVAALALVAAAVLLARGRRKSS